MSNEEYKRLIIKILDRISSPETLKQIYIFLLHFIS